MSCNSSHKDDLNTNSITTSRIKLFEETEDQIKKFREDSQKYWDKNDSENALKYSDSIKQLIIKSYISSYEFKTMRNIKYKTKNRNKPLFLQVTASWCAPCKFEISSLNKIAEKYSDKVDFVLLFWDNQKELKTFANSYNENIHLVPSERKEKEPTTINISGFKHITGYPTNYLISKDNQIINYSTGAAAPMTYVDETGTKHSISKDQANKENFNRLESEIKELLKKSETKK
ncbi:hypothetical protein BTO06_12000 [Tenacibaculum sp. SZ-18]|nr:hypothetical protein BTO06_12000 [Tenacibaculum sp. SZ-18]